MNGQWLGKYSGSNTGQIMINLDRLHDSFEGVAYLSDINDHLPAIAAFLRIELDSENFSFKTEQILPINKYTGTTDSWDVVRRQYGPNVRIPKTADVSGKYDGDSLKLWWTTDIDTHGSCDLPKSRSDLPSDIVPLEMNWETFKLDAVRDERRRFIFRGQNQPWRLRTSFHRSGRAELHRFVTKDIPMLHMNLSARTKHLFDLDKPKENGAFFNLVQHHGYPTPLLDWTYSPFVAAFFAYRNAPVQNTHEDKVRIYVFDQENWTSNFQQLEQLLMFAPHFSIAHFSAVENERMVPQQAVSTVTNIDDIETYIRGFEQGQEKYLWAIDLPLAERNTVLKELSYMGITAGSLFPGLDGACEELKIRNFEL